MNDLAEGKVFSARLETVFSGDDLKLMVDLGVDSLFKLVRVRLEGVDTPNAVHAGADTQAGKIRNEVLMTLKGKPLRLIRVREVRGSWVGTLQYNTPDGDWHSLNEKLIAAGHIYSEKKQT